VETVKIENTGNYVFINVAQGNYIVKATAPDTEKTLPTYYGNTENWQQATPITVTTVSIPNIDIVMIPCEEIEEGDSEVNGVVVETGKGKSPSPVEDVTVYLLSFKNNVWNTVSTTNSDASGFFKFGKLHAGRYMTVVDAPGLTMLNTIPFDLGASDTVKIVFTITDDGIGTKLGNVGIVTPTLPEIKVYPNPTTGELTIDNGQLTITKVEIYDVVGRKLFEQKENLTVLRSYDLTVFPSGLYFLRIQTEAGEVIKKVMKQ